MNKPKTLTKEQITTNIKASELIMIDAINEARYIDRQIFEAGDNTIIRVTDQVTYSTLGKERLNPYMPNRLGFCTGTSIDKKCLIIIWHGTKSKVSYHKSFIKKHEK